MQTIPKKNFSGERKKLISRLVVSGTKRQIVIAYILCFLNYLRLLKKAANRAERGLGGNCFVIVYHSLVVVGQVSPQGVDRISPRLVYLGHRTRWCLFPTCRVREQIHMVKCMQKVSGHLLLRHTELPIIIILTSKIKNFHS